MVLLLLSLFTPMIKRLTCSPNLLTANILNFFVKTLVSSPWIDLLLSSFFLMHLHYVLLCLTCFCCFQFYFVLFFIWKFKKKKKESKKYKNSVCFVYIGTCVPWMTIETKFSKLCISCSLDEHLYAQLSKWALWLLFVMSKIKLSRVLNTYITFFNRKDYKILRLMHK